MTDVKIGSSTPAAPCEGFRVGEKAARGSIFMRSRAALTIAVISALHAAPALSAEPDVLAPRGPWALVSHAERCAVVRDFGDEGDLRLRIETSGSKKNFDVTISGKAVPFKRGGGTQIRVGFSPDTAPREKFSVLHGQIGSHASVEFPTGFFPGLDALDEPLRSAKEWTADQQAEVARIHEEYMNRVSSMTVEFALRPPLHIETGNITEPLARLRGCVDRMMIKWGYDPATLPALSREAAPLPETLEAVRERMRGLAVRRGITSIPVRVRVDALGRATDCVVQTELTARVREFLCAALMGAYTPALDTNGHAVPDLYTTSLVVVTN